MKKIHDSLPRNCQLSLIDGVIKNLEFSISQKGISDFADYLKGAKDKINPEFNLADSFVNDIDRSFMKFITKEKTSDYSPLSVSSPTKVITPEDVKIKRKNVVLEFEKFDTDATVLKTLSKVCDQSGPLGALLAATQEMAQDGERYFNTFGVESDLVQIGKSSRSYVEISKTKNGDFQVRYTHLGRMTNLQDSDNKSVCAINRNLDIDFNQDVDKSMDNHTFSCEFLIEYKREDLLKSIIKPNLIGTPEVKMKIQIDWTKIDENFRAP